MHIYAIGGAVGVGQATTDTAFGPDVSVAGFMGGGGGGGQGTEAGVNGGRAGGGAAATDTAFGPDVRVAESLGGDGRGGGDGGGGGLGERREGWGDDGHRLRAGSPRCTVHGREGEGGSGDGQGG